MSLTALKNAYADDPMQEVDGLDLVFLRLKAKAIGDSNGRGAEWQAPCTHLMCLFYYAGLGSPLHEWLNEKRKLKRKIACGLKELEGKA